MTLTPKSTTCIWLDIGVPSLRNLRRISTRRVVLWWLLALSSIPLHLLYNSAVFPTLPVQRYQVYIVSNDFVDGADFDMPITHKGQYLGFRGSASIPDARTRLQGYQKSISSLSKLDNAECIEAYSPSNQTKFTDVVLVSSATNAKNSVIDVFFNVDSSELTNGTYSYNSWICSTPQSSSGCDFTSLKNNPQDWNITCSGMNDPSILSEKEDIVAPIQYCLTPPRGEQCKLQLSVAIIIIVLLCNLVKAVCIGLIAWDKNTKPLVTVGDAIASFLRQSDTSTEGSCIVGKTGFGRRQEWPRRPSQWTQEAIRWYQVVSTRRWTACIVL